MTSPYWQPSQLPGGAAYPQPMYPPQPPPAYYQPAPAYYYPGHPYPQIPQSHPLPVQWPPAQAAQSPWQTSRMSLYPELHMLLAADTTQVRFSLRRDPREAIRFDAQELAHHSAVREPVQKMRLVGRDFPWVVDIVPRVGYHHVVVGDIWAGLYRALQEPLTASEWILAGAMDAQRGIEEAMERRLARGDKDKFAKRIDWLGKSRLFKGLTKDELTLKRPLLPGTEPCAETWVVLLGVS